MLHKETGLLLKRCRVCTGCRFYESYKTSCQLGFKIKVRYVLDAPFNGVPQEPCLKATTYREYLDILNAFDTARNT